MIHVEHQMEEMELVSLHQSVLLREALHLEHVLHHLEFAVFFPLLAVDQPVQIIHTQSSVHSMWPQIPALALTLFASRLLTFANSELTTRPWKSLDPEP